MMHIEVDEEKEAVEYDDLRFGDMFRYLKGQHTYLKIRVSEPSALHKIQGKRTFVSLETGMLYFKEGHFKVIRYDGVLTIKKSKGM